jgi:biotin synthase
MPDTIQQILNKENFSKEDIVALLKTEGKDRTLLFETSAKIKEKYIGKKVFYRGLIEFSNICAKNCLYCGIRAGNNNVIRYEVTEEEIFEAVKFAHKSRYGSIVLQSGEREDKAFVSRITSILKKIKEITNDELGITLSLGEQTEETYQQWFDCGAHRYLLRIETSNQELYSKIHPNNSKHSFAKRLEALNTLRKVGYQVGTGVMIGLPFQTVENLAEDIIFIRDFDVDMVGMGPYIEHEHTPLFEFKDSLWTKLQRFDMSLKMIAVLRIVMKDINMAATTAMQTLDKMGREKAIRIGANIIMPNITPTKYRENYLLYEDKPCLDEDAEECKTCLEARIHIAGGEVGYGEWGDSPHFKNKKKDN